MAKVDVASTRAQTAPMKTVDGRTTAAPATASAARGVGKRHPRLVAPRTGTTLRSPWTPDVASAETI